MSSWGQKSTTHSPIHTLSHTHTHAYTQSTSVCKCAYAEYGLFYRIQHSTFKTAWLNDLLTSMCSLSTWTPQPEWLGILAKTWTWHLKNIKVQKQSNVRCYTRSTFLEMRTHIQTGCNMATLLPDVLPVTFVHMCRKWKHIATRLSCARAAWVNVCPSWLTRCLSVSSEPISGSCARYRRVLQKCWRPCQLFMGIMLFKKQLCVTATTTSKVDKNCWNTSLVVRKLQLLWMQKQF